MRHWAYKYSLLITFYISRIYDINFNLSSNIFFNKIIYSSILSVEDGKTYWRRDCIDSEHMSIGCQKEGINGTEIEYCVCKEGGCNKEMGELPTSSTTATTTQPSIRSFASFKNILRFIFKHAFF